MNSSEDNFDNSDDFQIGELIRFIIKNNKLISTITLIGTLLSGIYIYRMRNIWSGGFQIVLNTSEPKTFEGLDSNFAASAQLLGVDLNITDDLSTQIEIIQSPSILIDIFNFAKDKKIKKNKNYENLRFNTWKKNFKFVLKKKTSVLNVSYKDEDKELIIPILEKISSKFQDYSGEKRKRQINLGINYYEDQINFYKQKSLNSLTKAQKFGTDNNLSIIPSSNNKLNSSLSKESTSMTDVEKRRMTAFNEIQIINEQIPKVKALKGVSNEVLFLTAMLDQLNENHKSKIPLEIEEIDTELSKRLTIYKKDDLTVKNLRKQKTNLTVLLKEQVLELLTAKKDIATAQMNSSQRSPEVIIKYKRLITESSRDESTYEKLISEYNALKLFKAQDIDPWKLITNPTLIPNPIAPKRINLFVSSLTFSFLLGCVLSYSKGLIKSFSSLINEDKMKK